MPSTVAMTGPVSSYLNSEIDRRLRRDRVLVWYDPARAFEHFVDALSLDHCETLRFEGSFFRLRKEAEPVTATLRNGRPDEKSLLVYVPRPSLEQKQNVLYPLECLGSTFSEDLEAVTLRAVGDRFSRERIKEWLAPSGITLEQLDELAVDGSEIGSLATVLGKVTPEEAGLRFLEDPGAADAIHSQGMLDALTALLERSFGVVVPSNTADPKKVRDAFAQRVLINEFLDDLDEIPDALEHLDLPDQAAQIAACRTLAKRLRDSRSLSRSYERWARNAVDLFDLTRPGYDAEKIGRRDTFLFEERLALAHVHTLATAGDWQQAKAWAEERGTSFWAEADPTRKSQWDAALQATELWLAADRWLGHLPKKQSPQHWIELYTDRVEDALWRVDRRLRKLDSLAASFIGHEAISEIVRFAREHAHELERVLAERFIDSVEKATDPLQDLPVQAEVFADRVQLLLQQRKVVFVLADALRYEMGKELAEALTDSGKVETDFAVATPPTITKVGMAALIPGAEDGLELAAGDGEVVPVISGQRLPHINARLQRFRAEYDDRVADITLDDCLNKKSKQLEELVAGADLILLRSQDIDAIGEQDNLHHARTAMSMVVKRLQSALRRLSGAGEQDFIIVADHGYILREDITDAMKLDVPSGDKLESHRRCVIGRNLGAGDHHVTFHAADFGLAGALDLAFPRGVNIFKTRGGNLVYMHGGLSLQELIVPVIRYTPAVQEAGTQKPSVHIELTGPKITNAFFQARLSYQAGDLFDQQGTRKFHVVIVQDDTVIGHTVGASEGYREAGGEVELKNGEESVLMLQLSDPPSGSGTVELQVSDSEAGETISKKEVAYDLAF